jgi:hypothetical protein
MAAIEVCDERLLATKRKIDGMERRKGNDIDLRIRQHVTNGYYDWIAAICTRLDMAVLPAEDERDKVVRHLK